MLFVSTFTGFCAGRFLCLVVPQQPGCLYPHPGLEVAQATGQEVGEGRGGCSQPDNARSGAEPESFPSLFSPVFQAD